jgi:protein O-GlcNAc transferase
MCQCRRYPPLKCNVWHPFHSAATQPTVAIQRSRWSLDASGICQSGPNPAKPAAVWAQTALRRSTEGLRHVTAPQTADPAIEAWLDRAEAALARGAPPDLVEALTAAAAAHPGHARLACRAADALHLAGHRAAAMVAYDRALALDDGLFDAWYGLGALHLAAGACGDALDALERALALRPDAAGARCNLAEARFKLGLVDAAVADYRRAAAEGDAAVRANALRAIALIVVGADTADNAAVLAARRDWAATLGSAAPRKRPPPDPQGRLRVGYLSAYFGARNWMKPVWAVINRHDRTRFAIHLLSDGGDPSAESGYRDHPQDHIWPVRGMPNDALARAIEAAGLDVLVDLNGYSAQLRLPLFLRRPAPRILGWFNMFATTGMAVFDAIIGDDAVLPAAEEPFYAEPVVRVPGSYLAFEVGYPVPPVAPPPCLGTAGLPAGQITFGCLGSGYKLTDCVLDAWACILAGAPAARLFLKAKLFDDASNAAVLRARLAARGVAETRLVLAGGAEHYAFLADYAQVDIALDTFPYNGGTTTTEALWQGVPVLTFDGDRWAGRTSKSLLLAAGLAEWVAPDVHGYVAQAIALARDPATPRRLAALRESMRERLAASAVCDTERLCRALEAAYGAAPPALGE